MVFVSKGNRHGMKRYIISLTFLMTFLFFTARVAKGEFDTILSDTTKTEIDSTTVPDSLISPDDILEEQKQPKKSVSYFIFDDTITTCLLNRRLDNSEDVSRSYHRDAADLIRYDPSVFPIEYQSSPFRKTLSPYALPGRRLNVVFDKRALHPFEQLIEPDNKIDFNDIPTAPVEEAYHISGPLGMVFGGDNAASSMILKPKMPDSAGPKSKLVVDKGSFGYAYTKALFVNRYSGGQELYLAAGYRKAVGAYANRDDDAYHHWGEYIHPIRNNIRLKLGGRLYRRTGTYIVRPYISNFYLGRSRRDRDLHAGLEIAHDDNSSSFLEYRHQRSEANLKRSNVLYYHNFDVFDNSVTITHNRKLAGNPLRIKSSVSFERFTEAGIEQNRKRAFGEMTYFIGDSGKSLLNYIKLEKVVGFSPAPSAAVIFTQSQKIYYLTASIGYSTIFPSLTQLYMAPRQTQILSLTGPDYYESGNLALVPEKQLIGNISFGLGKIGSDLLLSATGGKIFDGIDWIKQNKLGLTLGEFVAGNYDIEFASFTARQKISWRDKLYLSGGGSYYHVMIDGSEDIPYSPDYRLFANLELHHYIKKYNLHINGYAEASYTDPYYGNLGRKLGNKVSLNGRWSFRIKRFTFFYVYQNIPAYVYQQREDYSIPGRYIYYGVTWEFLE